MFHFPVAIKHVGWQLNRYSRPNGLKVASIRIVSFSNSSGFNDGTQRQPRRSRSGSKQSKEGNHRRHQHVTRQVQYSKFNKIESSSAVGDLIRLSKLMSQLDICSRREADEWIRQGRILVHGKAAVLGFKVDPTLVNENDITILTNAELRDYHNNKYDPASSQQEPRKPRHDIDFASIVLHKPIGYVSGQAEHDNIPAIRLVTMERLWRSRPQNKPRRRRQDHGDFEQDFDDDSSIEYWEKWNQRLHQPSFFSWTDGLAPAGRLDCDSSGLMVMTQSGVLAKKIVGQQASLEKEYVVHVEPAVQMNRIERRKIMLQPSRRTHGNDDDDEASTSFQLPKTTNKLGILKRGGAFLLGESRPLAPCRAKWIEVGKTLQLTLTEGRKHHIRRACRELLGYHVTKLHRTRIGPISLPIASYDQRPGLESLPEGKWRPLTPFEIDSILKS